MKTHKRLIQQPSLMLAGLVTVCLLLVPLIAMQLTSEVKWQIGDFIVGGLLIFTATFGLTKVAVRHIDTKNRTGLIIALLGVFLLLWTHLALGLANTHVLLLNLLMTCVVCLVVLAIIRSYRQLKFGTHLL